MENQANYNDQRSQPRVAVDFPATISVGTQLTVKGQLRDLSLNSAFIKIKSTIYLKINDEIGITIQLSSDEAGVQITGQARISRMVPGEGFAVYFTKIDENSLQQIKKLLQKTST